MSLATQEVPVRPEGLELIGEMRGSGYRRPPSLVRRADGQTIQLTPLLYTVLEEIRDERTFEEVAERVSTRLDRTVTADNVRHLVDRQLRPLGLLLRADGSAPELKRSNPLLGLRMRFAITNRELTERLTRPFVLLFHPLLVFLATAGFMAVAWWVLMHKGLGSATYEAFKHPALLVLIVVVMLVSAGFHEFGHAAAARRGGARPGVMGAGLYLVWPAFYTDVTDAYRLGRLGRIRTDLGGLYFDALVVVGVYGVWAATGWDGWLLIVASQVFGMLRQLTPLVRFDGYHILCDTTGVPDLYSRIGPILLSFLPKHWHSPKVSALKPWVRVVVTLWVLVVVPVLAFSLVAMVLALPRVAGTAWSRGLQHAHLLDQAVADGDPGAAAARVVAILAVLFPVGAMGLMLGRLAWSLGKRAWVRTRGKPVKRLMAGALAALMTAGVAYAWWPSPGRYRPVQPWERGTLLDSGVVQQWTAPSTVQAGYLGRTAVSWPTGAALPTEDHPQLALVLIPHNGASTTTTGATGTVAHGTEQSGSGDQTWVFPFNRPLAPGEGDNQAMAINTTDGGTTYDVAFAMVWVENGEDVDNRNEAYALASCTDCTTVAIAFQVVMVVGQSDIIIPQNIAAAANYNCLSCVTVALAQQLILSVSGMPSDEAMQQIVDLWNDLAGFATHITEYSLTEIRDRLDQFEEDLQQILVDDGVLTVPDRSALEPSTTPSPDAQQTAPTDAATGDTSGAGDSGATPGTTDTGTGTTGESTGTTSDGTSDSTGTTSEGTGDSTGTTSGGGTTTSTQTQDPTSPSPTPTPTPTDPTATPTG